MEETDTFEPETVLSAEVAALVEEAPGRLGGGEAVLGREEAVGEEEVVGEEEEVVVREEDSSISSRH